MEFGPQPEELVRSANTEVVGEPTTDVRTRRRYLDRAIVIVDRVASETSDPSQAALLAASTSLMVAASGPQPIGQCKEATPFADIYVVFDSNGHRFECLHDPPHSSAM